MSKLAQDIIIKPVISEKSSYDTAIGKYTFQVARTATKTDVRKAAEQLFGVKVVSVNTVNYDGKKKRQRYVEGTTPAYKKAVVTIDMEAKDVSISARAERPLSPTRSIRHLLKNLESASNAA